MNFFFPSEQFEITFAKKSVNILPLCTKKQLALKLLQNAHFQINRLNFFEIQRSDNYEKTMCTKR
jgi:hypothetical protein